MLAWSQSQKFGHDLGLVTLASASALFFWMQCQCLFFF